jgi:hypothetical protein
VALARTATDSLALGNAVARVLTLARTAADGLGSSDAVTRIATLFRAAEKSGEVFAPLPPTLAVLHKRLKATFDDLGMLARDLAAAEPQAIRLPPPDRKRQPVDDDHPFAEGVADFESGIRHGYMSSSTRTAARPHGQPTERDHTGHDHSDPGRPPCAGPANRHRYEPGGQRRDQQDDHRASTPSAVPRGYRPVWQGDRRRRAASIAYDRFLGDFQIAGSTFHRSARTIMK